MKLIIKGFLFYAFIAFVLISLTVMNTLSFGQIVLVLMLITMWALGLLVVFKEGDKEDFNKITFRHLFDSNMRD